MAKRKSQVPEGISLRYVLFQIHRALPIVILVGSGTALLAGVYIEITKPEDKPVNTVIESGDRGDEAKAAFKVAVKQLLPKKTLGDNISSRYEQGSKSWGMEGSVSAPDELGVIRNQTVLGKLVYFRGKVGERWILLELLMNGVQIQSNPIPGGDGSDPENENGSGKKAGKVKEEAKPFLTDPGGPGFLGLGVAGVLFGMLHLAVVLEQLKSRQRDSLWKLKMATEAFDRGQIEHAQELLIRLQEVYPGTAAAQQARELSLKIEKEYPPAPKA